jgi:hypothetical protein
MLPFIIRALATLRVAILITEEDGPFDIVPRLRARISNWVWEDDVYHLERGWAEDGIVCLWCVSFWVGLIISTLSGRSPLYGLALSASAMLLYKEFFEEGKEED